MPAGPQDILNNVKELILKHIRQSVDAESDRPRAPKLGGNGDDKLQGLDVELHAIEETITSLQTGLRTWITQRKTQRNDLIHLNKLPLEIASNILWLSIVDPWQQEISFSFLQRLRTISWVCSSWRALVEGSPRFWSIIEFSGPKPVILDFLQKSGSSPLEIKCFSDGNYRCTPPRGLVGHVERHCLKLVAPHTHRIQSLIFSACVADGLLPILQTPAPMLEELRLELMDDFLEEPLDLFSGRADRLRDVELENILFRWDSAALSGLRSLKIKGEVDSWPTEAQVRRLLEANPGLETMEMEGLMIVDGSIDSLVESSDGNGGKPTRVAMSRMQKLRLFGLPFELAQAVLGNVEIPSIKHFDLKCLFRGQPASRLLGPNLKHIVPPLLQGSQGAHLAEITFGKTNVGFEISARGQHPIIRIELENTTPISGFGWLAEHFLLAERLPSACEVEVSIKFRDNFDMAGGAFIPIFDQLGVVKVTALTIESSCSRGDGLIKYLGEANENSLLPFPHLVSLRVGGRAHLANHVLSALQCRKATPTEGAPRPVQLEVLDLGAMELLQSEIEQALAECVSSSGSFTRASRRPGSYRSGFGGFWTYFGDGDVEEDMSFYSEPSAWL